MIPKSSKFPLRTEFLRFRARAERLVSPHLQLFYLPHTPSEATGEVGRLAVVVPKKLSKLATTRNWLKRLTYNTIWPLIRDKKLDCVVVYKPLPLKKSLANQRDIVHELTQTIGNL